MNNEWIDFGNALKEQGALIIAFREDNKLRDWFAGMALQGLIASHANPATTSLPNTETDFETLSTTSYKYADAMIKARSAK